MTGLNILTVNVRGTIKNPQQRNKLLSCVQLQDINILSLQETHVCDMKYKFEIDRIFDCKLYWSFGTNDSKGVAILVMNNFDRTIEKFERDIDGRIVTVNIRSELRNFKIVNVYAPNNNTEKKNIFSKTLIGSL